MEERDKGEQTVELLRRATSSVNGGIVQAEHKNPYSNQDHGTTFHVIGKAQILCFTGLYVRSDLATRGQVKASFFYILLSAAVQNGWLNHIPAAQPIYCMHIIMQYIL